MSPELGPSPTGTVILPLMSHLAAADQGHTCPPRAPFLRRTLWAHPTSSRHGLPRAHLQTGPVSKRSRAGEDATWGALVEEGRRPCLGPGRRLARMRVEHHAPPKHELERALRFVPLGARRRTAALERLRWSSAFTHGHTMACWAGQLRGTPQRERGSLWPRNYGHTASAK